MLIDGRNINLEQIKLGMAWHYKKYQNELVANDRLYYLHAQEAAEISKSGLRLDVEHVAPWEFRKSKKTE